MSSEKEAVSSLTRGRGEEEPWEDTNASTGESVRLFRGVKDSGILGVFRLEASSFPGARGAIAMSAAAIEERGDDKHAQRNGTND